LPSSTVACRSGFKAPLLTSDRLRVCDVGEQIVRNGNLLDRAHHRQGTGSRLRGFGPCQRPTGLCFWSPVIVKAGQPGNMLQLT
jgi:hypothetical protein